MILYHFSHWPRAMGTTNVAPGPLAIDCLRPGQWCKALDDTCVWLTANPDPSPVSQPANVCPYVRIEMRLPRTWRLRKPKRDIVDWNMMADEYGADMVRRQVNAMKRDWWKSYETIPREYFTGLEVTGEPFWCGGGV